MRRARELRRRTIEPCRPLHRVIQDGAWSGEPCFIIGGGPSLIGFDFERLRGRGRIIAINRAYEFCQFADALFYMDDLFYKTCYRDPGKRRLWDAFAGYKVQLYLQGRCHPDAHAVRAAGRMGLSASLAGGIFHGNNSGIGAVNLAVCLKADPIYLLGFDFKFQGPVSHFHGGYGAPQHERTYLAFARDFAHLARLTTQAGIMIINLNPQSALRAFPFMTIDNALGSGQGRANG
jgi:hypothetical protein